MYRISCSCVTFVMLSRRALVSLFVTDRARLYAFSSCKFYIII